MHGVAQDLLGFVLNRVVLSLVCGSFDGPPPREALGFLLFERHKKVPNKMKNENRPKKGRPEKSSHLFLLWNQIILPPTTSPNPPFRLADHINTQPRTLPRQNSLRLSFSGVHRYAHSCVCHGLAHPKVPEQVASYCYFWAFNPGRV